MEIYKFEAFRHNIFILNYNDKENNIKFKKLIKIPITLEVDDINCEYENYNIINKTIYNNLFEKIDNSYTFKNIDIDTDLLLNLEYNEKKIEIIINFKHIIRENILSNKLLVETILDIKKDNIIFNNQIINLKRMNILSNENIIDYYYINSLTLLILNYNEDNITLYSKISSSKNDMYNNIKLIKDVLHNISILHKNINFIHGDLKLNNILYNKKENNSIFIDLEFSKFINDKFINISSIEYINTYLNLNNKLYINKKFLEIFDIYLFVFSLFMSNNMEYSGKFIMTLTEMINDINYEENKYFYIFYFLYKSLYKYSIFNEIKLTNITDQEFYEYCKFKNIYKIFYFSRVVEYNNNIKNILLYINGIFDDFFIKNNTTNSYDNLIKLNNYRKII